ncbi:MAG: peptidoglycan recognition family protein [Planctomycetota bacterium]
MSRHAPNHDIDLARRLAVRAGLAGLAAFGLFGCASSGRSEESADLPDPIWPESPVKKRQRERAMAERTTPPPSKRYGTPDVSAPSGVIPRSSWAGGNPVPRLMDRMRPVRRITLHHDGMNVFTSTNRADAAERIENIRNAHRSQNWGDIGYHYVVDPGGRIWQGRPLTWQGAHVGGQNEHNLGICVLGNYDRQRPTSVQINAIERFVAQEMSRYRVDVSQVYTHQELAATACPGRNLQARLVQLRRYGGGLT